VWALLRAERFAEDVGGEFVGVAGDGVHGEELWVKGRECPASAAQPK
jgi:hypothetical protein